MRALVRAAHGISCSTTIRHRESSFRVDELQNRRLWITGCPAPGPRIRRVAFWPALVDNPSFHNPTEFSGARHETYTIDFVVIRATRFELGRMGSRCEVRRGHCRQGYGARNQESRHENSG